MNLNINNKIAQSRLNRQEYRDKKSYNSDIASFKNQTNTKKLIKLYHQRCLTELLEILNLSDLEAIATLNSIREEIAA
jgi:hypothetical protein